MLQQKIIILMLQQKTERQNLMRPNFKPLATFSVSTHNGKKNQLMVMFMIPGLFEILPQSNIQGRELECTEISLCRIGYKEFNQLDITENMIAVLPIYPFQYNFCCPLYGCKRGRTNGKKFEMQWREILSVFCPPNSVNHSCQLPD